MALAAAGPPVDHGRGPLGALPSGATAIAFVEAAY